ncbi:deoxynucleotidyltransferase terminal-interacting protein 2-like [Physella acuta]|uniref:deoxynucleotidyltransferase terminal-interacting protein 2-like n=1 Tax=Physella acuta TaxID=109671 RepID=UPI0027DAE7FB|nr:deoxynucleotidyltransferase terminal-interacting protein 2-like [Physella acuta]
MAKKRNTVNKSDGGSQNEKTTLQTHSGEASMEESDTDTDVKKPNLNKKPTLIDSSDEEDTSGSDESSASDDEDSSDTNENIPDKQLKHKNFRLSCLHDWDEEKLTSCVKKFFEETIAKNQQSGSALKIGGYSEDYTPWWEEFSKPKQIGIMHAAKKIHQVQDDDTFDNWFDKTPKEGTNWLCGPSSAPKLQSEKKSAVEDIEVPSIYDVRPPAKGRRALKKERRAEREKTLGDKWFGMKAPDIDDKLKNDMELIRMRGALDPKKFYKHQDRKALPKYFQMGTVVDEGTDFYSSRLTKKQRKQTLVEELMADANIRQYNKRKYSELQQKMRVKKSKLKQKS